MLQRFDKGQKACLGVGKDDKEKNVKFFLFSSSN